MFPFTPAPVRRGLQWPMPDSATRQRAASERHLQCTEVWGGNRAATEHLVVPGLDVWLYSRPCGDEAGGDVHYVSSCASGRITRLLVADVAGHGMSVDQSARALRNLIRRYVIYPDQARLVRAMNWRFTGMSREGQFATAVVGSYNAVRQRLSLSIAGHPPPLLRRAAEGRWTVLQAPEDQPHGLPLGVETTARFGEFGATLGADDMLLCYTDGLIEARRDAGEFLGIQGLMNLLDGVPAEPATLLERLVDAVESRGMRLDCDDTTIMLVRATGARYFPPLHRFLTAPGKILVSIIRSWSNR